MLAFLQRAIGETAELRGRLDALHSELEATAARLAATFGELPKLTAVAPAPEMPQSPEPAAAGPPLLDPTSPAMSVAIEMAVAGASRAEVHERLSGAFSIAQPDAIIDAVFGPSV
jgi:hypothetical protein